MIFKNHPIAQEDDKVCRSLCVGATTSVPLKNKGEFNRGVPLKVWRETSNWLVEVVDEKKLGKYEKDMLHKIYK